MTEYIQTLFGKHALQSACNYVVQPENDNRAAVIGTTSFAREMSFGGVDHGVHTLVLCDMIIRPRLVIASDHMRGAGAAGLLKYGMSEAETWLKNGKIILNNT